MTGPELHANIVATLHDRAFITTPWWLASLPWCLFLGAALGHAFLRLDLGAGFAVALVHHFGWKAAALAAFVFGYWRVEMSAMLLLGALTYSVAFRVALAQFCGECCGRSSPPRSRRPSKVIRTVCDSGASHAWLPSCSRTSAGSLIFRNGIAPPRSSRY